MYNMDKTQSPATIFSAEKMAWWLGASVEDRHDVKERKNEKIEIEKFEEIEMN